MSKHAVCRLVAALILLPGMAYAGPYSALYVFGDSLSDRGNLAEAVGEPFANPPSYQYSFTNGPVAVSQLASRFGLAADASLWVSGFQDTTGLFGPGYVPGTNYAVGGATAQETPANGLGGINLPDQVGAFLTHVGGVADPLALYTLFIGGNDVRDASLPGGGGAAAIAAGVSSEIQQLQALLGAGARDVLVVNVGDVGAIPEFALQNPTLAATATAYTVQYDTALAAALSGLSTPPGTSITQFDLLSYNRTLLDNAPLFGLTNTTDPCYSTPAIPVSGTPTAACGPNAENIGHLAYWNNVHPTATVHALWAEGFAQALAGNPHPSPIPEPASLALLVGALTMAGLHRDGRRRRADSLR